MKKFYLDQIGNDSKLLVRFREKTDDWETLSREDSRETYDRLFRTKATSELPPRRRPLQALGMLFENLLYQVTVVLVFGGALSILVIIIFTIVATIEDDKPVLHVYFISPPASKMAWPKRLSVLATMSGTFWTYIPRKMA